ncbi:MAG: hypothetical protein NT159_05860 [Proteobacteria bacterium]|nr:hypothetical protein [Pseudomonadota bacterium]
MKPSPAIPTLLLVPGETPLDYRALYAIATAYAHSGLLISSHGEKHDRIEFFFPAIVCSSFAIELFMKFFLMLDQTNKEPADRKHNSGHKLGELWKKINPEHQRLIAGMFGNSTATPHLNAADRRIELFVEALTDIGDAPFMKWRYAYELGEIGLMSHAAIAKVLDALGHAAEYIMKEDVRRD